MSLEIHSESSIASIVSARPMTARVFARHRIDFCCAGQRTLEAAARKAGIPLDTLIAELDIQPCGPSVSAAAMSDAELVEHIVTRHHRPLDEELPRLGALSDKVARVHGGHVNLAVREHFQALRDDLVQHMEKEERVLFPWILGGDRRARMPIQVLQDEHELVGEILSELRRLTCDFLPPPEACGSWRALWGGLEALEADLHTHIHLENNVLFPRVAAR